MTERRALALGPWPFILALLLLATGLRFFRLDYQSYWHDEGNSLHLAGESVPVIIRSAAADIHPPAYYLALKVWRAGLGETEFALRSFSALAGVALVALLYRLGREYFNVPAALAAAALGALNPFLIYYSQEARMYALLAALSAASFWLLFKWLKRGFLIFDFGFWIGSLGYVLVSALGLYTHYSFGFVILAQNVLMAGLLLVALATRRAPRFMAPPSGGVFRVAGLWLGLQAFTLLFYIPWLPTAYHQLTSWPAAREFQPFLTAFADMARYLAFGRTLKTEGLFASFVLIGLTLVVGFTRRGKFSAPLTWLIIPAGLTLGLGLFSEAFSKFLLVAVPPLCLLLGQGLAASLGDWRQAKEALHHPGRNLGRMALWAFGLLFVAAFGAATYASLQNLYFNPAYFRDDYRGMARYVASVERPGDAILLIAPNQIEAFGYYHRSGAEVFPLPHARPLDPAETTAALEAIVANHSRLFVLYWADEQADPGHFVESWLSAHTFKAGEAWYGQVRLATYAVSAPAAEPAAPSGAQFSAGAGARITLEGYTLQASTLSPGDILQITLFWQTDAPLAARYKVFVHVFSDPVQPPPAQQDGEPSGGLRPTTDWAPGQRYADNHGVLIPSDLPPGQYTLAIGLYNDATRLPVTRDGKNIGDRLELATITVK